MVPTAIARQAKGAGLDMIAICDHNSVANAAVVAKAGQRESLAVLPGVEITTREEVHILGVFSPERDLSEIQSLMDDNLSGENDEKAFGLQVVVDEWDEPTEVDEKLLIGATALTLEQAVEAIHRFGGLAIAAHIDREGFGLIGQLGFIPPGLPLDALEVSPRASAREWKEKCKRRFPVITSSDAHRLADVGRSSTTFLAREPSFDEVRKALAGEDGRELLSN
jgi:predicted metal-dependent phosphoesterase TrpH